MSAFFGCFGNFSRAGRFVEGVLTVFFPAPELFFKLVTSSVRALTNESSSFLVEFSVRSNITGLELIVAVEEEEEDVASSIVTVVAFSIKCFIRKVRASGCSLSSGTSSRKIS